MSIVETVMISIALAMDCFAVSLGVGTSPLGITRREGVRLSFHFGLFQGLMTLLGWLVGSTIVVWISQLDHWIALALLSWVGIRMILGGLKDGEEEEVKGHPARGFTMVILSVAVSIDALAVGLSMAVLKVNILGAASVIGLTSLIFGLGGIWLGRRLSERFGKRMEVVGGTILIIIGLRILISHLTGG